MHMQGVMSDRDIMQMILDEHKHSVASLAHMIVECSTPQLRNECLNALNGTIQHQQAIWELMHQRGWYQPHPASPQDVAMAQRAVTSHWTQGGGMSQGMQMPMSSSQMVMGGSHLQMGSGQMQMGGSQIGTGQAQGGQMHMGANQPY